MPAQLSWEDGEFGILNMSSGQPKLKAIGLWGMDKIVVHN